MFVAVLIGGGGWGYIYFFQQTRLSTLETEYSDKQSELQNKQQIANRYEDVLKNYESVNEYFQNYEKALYPDHNEEQVFDFLNRVNSGRAYTDFTFEFTDSTTNGEYGIINMKVEGSGYYRNVLNFVRRVELSKPVNKVEKMSIVPLNTLEDYGRVDFSFELDSYYNRSDIVEDQELAATDDILASIYNPFYPLIRENIEPNEDNLINIQSSKLLALSADRAFLINQSGALEKLHVGDKVYLGTLTNIDVNRRTATFRLNRGGIVEMVTLEVDNENSEEQNN